jgi:hypothetical protein
MDRFANDIGTFLVWLDMTSRASRDRRALASGNPPELGETGARVGLRSRFRKGAPAPREIQHSPVPRCKRAAVSCPQDVCTVLSGPGSSSVSAAVLRLGTRFCLVVRTRPTGFEPVTSGFVDRIVRSKSPANDRVACQEGT